MTSIAVLEELERGDFEARDDCLRLISELPLLGVDQAVIDVAATYMHRHVMPQDPKGDALHLATASFHHCDFLATWNCKPNRFAHVRRVNTMLGIHVPALVTPYELLGEDDGED